jgi:hypothetical protein
MLSSLFILTLLLTKTYADLSCMTTSSPFKVPIAGEDSTPPVAIAGPEFDPLNDDFIMDTNDKLKLDFYSDLVAANVGSGETVVLTGDVRLPFSSMEVQVQKVQVQPSVHLLLLEIGKRMLIKLEPTAYVFAEGGSVPDVANTVDGVKVTNALYSGIAPSGDGSNPADPADTQVATNPLTPPYAQDVATLHESESGDTIALQRLCYSSAVGDPKTMLTAEGKTTWGPASTTESWETSAQPVYCDYKQTVSYDMTYEAPNPLLKSCEIGSATPFYLNWATCTYTKPNGDSGVVNDGCTTMP